ncbi:hypothetical protein B0T20DRAFT_388619 [Sordaria brevicollis]|uniref:Uncharacterized protein n=1 Tax=Sordaria brevicollis TaxID=83679 RepID=A0AAE0PN68_SORBR|nr:hypothetical protein B0T20DRAFT_388619 [Sordaria brevicollis]
MPRQNAHPRTQDLEWLHGHMSIVVNLKKRCRVSRLLRRCATGGRQGRATLWCPPYIAQSAVAYKLFNFVIFIIDLYLLRSKLYKVLIDFYKVIINVYKIYINNDGNRLKPGIVAFER